MYYPQSSPVGQATPQTQRPSTSPTMDWQPPSSPGAQGDGYFGSPRASAAQYTTSSPWSQQVMPDSASTLSGPNQAPPSSGLSSFFSSQRPPVQHPPGTPQQTVDPETRLDWALQQDFPSNAFHLLSLMLQEASPRDLLPVLPRLMLSIVEGTRSWHIMSISAADSLDYVACYSFLRAEGPLHNLVLRIMEDFPDATFPFPVHMLPRPTVEAIERGGVPQFMLDRLPPNHVPGQTLTQLMMDAWDLWLFALAACPSLAAASGRGTRKAEQVKVSVYSATMESLITHYFPSNGRLRHLSFQDSGRPTQRRDGGGFPSPSSSFFRAGGGGVGSPSSVDGVMAAMEAQSMRRNQTLLSTLLDFWCQPLADQNHSSCRLPPVQVVLLVRSLVRQAHAISSTTIPRSKHPWDEFKRSLSPFVIEALVPFLKFLFLHWPFDESFRSVLETWLSAIQPWRYVDEGDPRRRAPTPAPEPTESTSDQPPRPDTLVEWKEFISHHPVLYNVFPRILVFKLFPGPCELTKHGKALLLYRFAKVFADPSLVEVLRSVAATSSSSSGFHSPRTSPPTHPHHHGTFHDEALFSADVEFDASPVVRDPAFLRQLSQVVSCAEEAKVMLETREQAGRRKSEGGTGGISAFFRFLMSTDEDAQVDARERAEAIKFLTNSVSEIVTSFNLAPPKPVDPNSVAALSSISGPYRRTIALKERIQNDIKHRTVLPRNPDTVPCTADESLYLVKQLYLLSTWINEKYGPSISLWYYSDGWRATVLRQLIRPPCSYWNRYRIAEGVIRRDPVTLPPRVSLRPLANVWLMMGLAFVILVGSALGFSLESLILCVLLGAVSWLILRGTWYFLFCPPDPPFTPPSVQAETVAFGTVTPIAATSGGRKKRLRSAGRSASFEASSAAGDM